MRAGVHCLQAGQRSPPASKPDTFAYCSEVEMDFIGIPILCSFSLRSTYLYPSSDMSWLSLALCSFIWILESAYQVPAYQATAIIKYKRVSRCNRSQPTDMPDVGSVSLELNHLIQMLGPCGHFISHNNFSPQLTSQYPAPHIWVRCESLKDFCLFVFVIVRLHDWQAFLMSKLAFLKGLWEMNQTSLRLAQYWTNRLSGSLILSLTKWLLWEL